MKEIEIKMNSPFDPDFCHVTKINFMNLTPSYELKRLCRLLF